MLRKYILTAISYKNHNYCLSGIDISDGMHYRLVSTDKTVEGAIHCFFVERSTTRKLKIRDIVEVKVLGEDSESFHPENIIIDETFSPKIISEVEYKDLLNSLTHYPQVLHSFTRSLGPEICNNIKSIDHSLELIHVQDLSIFSRFSFGKFKIYGNFTYNGNFYEKISITDPLTLVLYSKPYEFNYRVGEAILLISLGELYEKDRSRYKLIAGVHLPEIRS